MRIDVFTIFPELITNFAGESLLGRAQKDERIDLRTHNLRDHATGNHKSVDDTPFGGGPGMVMKPEPLFASIEAVNPPRPLYFLGPAGETFNQAKAQQLAEGPGFSLLCGRYEGVDERVLRSCTDGQISIGDYVLGGGEVAALVVIEAVTRLMPGVMGNDTSATEESFSVGLLEYPQYTRPASFRDMEIPDVLRSGNHGLVARWRHAQALARTIERRPDLIEARGGLSDEDQDLLREFGLGDFAPGE